jgi:glutamate racemase
MNTPVGIFDSGLGGLTVVKEFVREMPQEPAVYFGDTARVPYGTKSKDTITKFSAENIRFLNSFDVKLVIIACHTASSLALEEMQKQFSIPIIGVVYPGAFKAVKVTRNGRIGVIGTKSTIKSGAYDAAVRAANPEAIVYNVPCPLLVSLIEEGWNDGPIVDSIVAHYLKPLIAHDIDTLILGCTHYPIIADRIKAFLPDHVTLVNPARETALAARKLLKEMELSIAAPLPKNHVQYFVSDDPVTFKALGERFLGHELVSVELVSEARFNGKP